MRTRIVRVVPAENGWALEIEGPAERPHRFSSLEAAIAAGWHRAKHENAELHIHRQDGTVRLRSAIAEDSLGVKE
ncbi:MULTISPECIES: DUF2188 domain-containing protein [Cupriavidus]|uniref:DUF2188 domain-containing protein n=1 Tax=Cupriavidus sp. DF5525 TaxID=3160989 RepID=UPI0035A84A4B